MSRYNFRWLPVLLVFSLGLAACRREQTPTPSLTTVPTRISTSTAALTATEALATDTPAPTEITAAPVVALPSLTPTQSPGPYPAPGLASPTATTSSGTPYPASGVTPLPTATTSSGTSYPASGAQTPLAVIPTATPYPGPQQPTSPALATPTSAAIPYPGPGTVTQLPPPPGTPAPTVAASPTVTQGVVRTRIQASDPRSFQVVSGQPQLVEFFAYWSNTSRSMAPVVHALEDRYGERIRFVYLDIDDPQNSLFKSLINDRLPPLFYLLDGQGNVLAEWQGFVPAAEFESAFASLQP